MLMPRDMFGDVIDPSIKLGTRKWYSVPLSFVAHTSIVGALIVAPLVATGALPLPDEGPIVIDLAPPPLPEPPPVRRETPVETPVANRQAAPTVAPDSITPEPEIDAGFESRTATDSTLIGAAVIDGDATVTPPPPPAGAAASTKPVRPGGVIRAPERVTYVAPVYPTLALTARVRGLVIIEATIDTQGRVQEARVLRSDSQLLNDAALAAVRQWIYTPTLLNGVPVSVVMTVTVNFQIQ
jgi:protein TonB